MQPFGAAFIRVREIMKRKTPGEALYSLLEVVLMVTAVITILYGLFWADADDLFEKREARSDGYLYSAKEYDQCITLWQTVNKVVITTLPAEVEDMCKSSARAYPK